MWGNLIAWGSWLTLWLSPANMEASASPLAFLLVLFMAMAFLRPRKLLRRDNAAISLRHPTTAMACISMLQHLFDSQATRPY
jgi:hypothetical protein